MFLGPTIKYDLDVGTFYGQYGVITDPRIGYLRDGMTFLGATFGWKGVGTGVGSVADFPFDEYDKGLEERVPSVAFGYWVKDILKTMKAGSWDELKGKPVITLWESETGLGSFCRGISNPATNDYIVWDQWWEEVGYPLIGGKDESR